MQGIIDDSNDADTHFWENFDIDQKEIPFLETLAKELEKSWSPHVVLNHLVSLEEVKKDSAKRMDETAHMVIVLIKKLLLNFKI